MSGINAIITIRTEFPEARIVEGDVDIQRALEAQAGGYALKSMPAKELVAVIRQVHGARRRIPWG
jgi:DNA-binding NarL/FixJ family response regulator